MIVAIHQPSYLPWIPFLEKGLRSDIYVFHDNVQFDKNGEQNRNRIKTPQGAAWLTVPVVRHTETLISEVQIAEAELGWARKHRRMIEENYRKAPYFDAIAGALFPLLERTWTSLCELNLAIDKLFLEWTGFSGKIVLASDLDITGTGWQRVLEICQAVGATTYRSGIGARSYMNVPAFEAAGVKTLFQQYHHAEYPQRFPQLGFIAGLSALDLFMNVGTGDVAREFILANSRWATLAELPEETSP